ncbi:copper chaperone PCu(A)C [Pseudomonas sp. KNUC1026]|uniref:copper chaperone PCu(A)C n=1 Tax=Pseudomonas sp. KNUC1026 TaxID=2893890 RepID=UPI001F2EBBA5|nr:copper chaperone PCu(A)C [Pseudomonas sp. KNUC1026]UFH49077.1 copper chaperone PCu(A)C [Pseudomonas sp. KNUC1026]
MRSLPRLAFIPLLLLTGQALAAITVSAPWSQALPPGSPAIAAYFTVHNDGTEDDVLTGIASPIAGEAGMRQSTGEDGMMKMQAISSAVVPAAGNLTFQPMGYHAMLMGIAPGTELQPGSHFPLTLHFKQAGDITVDVQVLQDAPAHDHGT